MNLDKIKEELVSDAFDTCINDSSYLISILQTYFNTFSEEDLCKMYADAFDTGDDYEEGN